jgi:glucose-1-phosphate cytidylyltransferase
MSDITIDLVSGEHTIHNSQSEDWRITIVDTGADTMTGGRIKRIKPFVNNETFCLTYGDGLSNINITDEIKFHRQHGKLATVVAVRPPGRFGVLSIDNKHNVTSFEEKPSDEIGSINGGFFVLEPGVFDYIENDSTIWEREPLSNLAKQGQLNAYTHSGYWQPCDTLRDKRALESLWDTGQAPWKIWFQ